MGEKKNYLTRENFLSLPDLAINPLGDRIVHAFFQSGHETDHRDFNRMEFPDFVKVLARFRPIKSEQFKERNVLNSRRDKLRFVFRMYDIDGDNQISKTEIMAVLGMMIGNNEISPEELEKISRNVVNECSRDDNLINFSEFCVAMEKVDVEHTMSIRLS